MSGNGIQEKRPIRNMARHLAMFLMLSLAAPAAGEPLPSSAPAAAASSGNPRQEEAAPVRPAASYPGSMNVTIDFDNVDIQTFIKAIGEMTGKNFVIDKQVQGSVTVFSPKQITAEEAYRVFQSVLEMHGFTTVPAGNITKILPLKDAREKSIATLTQEESAGPEDRLVTRIVKLKYGNPEEVKKVLDPLVSRQSIVQSYPPSGMLIITDVQTNIARLVKIIDALDGELNKSTATVNVYPLQNANAEELAKALLNLYPKSASPGSDKGRFALSRNVQVLPDKTTNSLVITASAEDYAILQGLIRQLDAPRPMVYIEALILEVDVKRDLNLGTEWRAMKDVNSSTGEGLWQIGSGGLGKSGSYAILPNNMTKYASGFAFGLLGKGITIGGSQFADIGAMIQAIKNDSDVHILSKPQLLTMDSEEAQIQVGKNVPYMTRQETSTTDRDYSTYEYRDVGVSLKITPHVSSDGYVRMKIAQEVSQLTSESSSGLPTTLKRTINTTVTVKDAETMVIGGMIGDSTQLGTYKVPLLGDIPLLGWLFKSRSTNREKTNLYVFITPRVIRDSGDSNGIYQEKNDHIEKLKNEFFPAERKKATPDSGDTHGH